MTENTVCREDVASWMILRGYKDGGGETVQDLLFEIEAQAKGRGGSPELPPGEGDWRLARAEIERLRAIAERAQLAVNEWHAYGGVKEPIADQLEALEELLDAEQREPKS